MYDRFFITSAKIALFGLFLIVVNPLFSQELIYTDGANAWNADTLGNHRAVLEFNGNSIFAKATIAWRRHDLNPAEKRIIVQDAKTGKKITNVQVVSFDREAGTILFEPISGKGIYYVYYMPYKYEGPKSYYPKGVYWKQEQTASAAWLSSIVSSTKVNCKVKEIQSVNAFNSFYPMEVIATAAEKSALVTKSSSKSFLVFTEDRMHPIKMQNDLPQRWILKGNQSSFSDKALRGEYLAFQLGIYALSDLPEVYIEFTDLTSLIGKKIAAKNLQCINTNGIKYDGSIF